MQFQFVDYNYTKQVIWPWLFNPDLHREHKEWGRESTWLCGKSSVLVTWLSDWYRILVVRSTCDFRGHVNDLIWRRRKQTNVVRKTSIATGVSELEVKMKSAKDAAAAPLHSWTDLVKPKVIGFRWFQKKCSTKICVCNMYVHAIQWRKCYPWVLAGIFTPSVERLCNKKRSSLCAFCPK